MENFGYIRLGAVVPEIRVADVDYNISRISSMLVKAEEEGADLVVFPELCVTGYTCGDLFGMELMLDSAEQGVVKLAGETAGSGVAFAVGCPVRFGGRLYNCAVVVAGGRISGIVPKVNLPNYSEFYEQRWFASGKGISSAFVDFGGESVPFGTDLLFETKGVKFGIEICEDVWVPVPPSSVMSQAGAEVILNLSASDELIGKHDYLLGLLSQQSARCRCGYAYASAGWGESSTDLVYAGNAVVCENGSVSAVSERFVPGPLISFREIDIERLRNDRRKAMTFHDGTVVDRFRIVKLKEIESAGIREPQIEVNPLPFVPEEKGDLSQRCEEITSIQARGLMQRLCAINCTRVVIGISGGLDSTLALLVAVKAFDALGFDRKGIYGITMPGTATTSRTHGNAVGLMEELGVTSVEIPIGKAVEQHFSDIGHDRCKYDVTYENSQARERTQILMDYANKVGGIVVGTGDMSELALGWCTYNGDHMSMYAVNSSVPKTLVRHLVKWFSTKYGANAESILLDIVDTPISPELVPYGVDEIGQITEDLVGPYELHDFFMYHVLRNGFGPRKIHMLARKAFAGKYEGKVLLKWLRNFFKRFFQQQFKRSCMPDGPKVGSVNLSPRGDWRMPSDACAGLWLREIDSLEIEESK